MQTLDAIQTRRSTRLFTDQQITDQDMEKILMAGVHAPTGSNSQNVRFLLVRDKEEIERIGKIRFIWSYKDIKPRPEYGIVGGANAIIFVFADHNKGSMSAMWQFLNGQNACAAIQNMLLAATDLKIGSCWISLHNDLNHTKQLRGTAWRSMLKDYNVPLSCVPYGMVILGYPQEVDEDGYPLGDKMHYNRPVERKDLGSYLIRPR